MSSKNRLGYYGMLAKQRLQFRKLQKDSVIHPNLFSYISRKDSSKKYLSLDKEKLKSMRLKARQTVEEYYNWKRVSEETEKVLLELTQ